MKYIYFVNGFLDAGKTTFIKDLLCQDYFDTGERKLLLLCEEGEEEYEEKFCQIHNVVIKTIESEDEYTEENIQKLEKEVHPERIIVEFNGMWNRKHRVQQWKEADMMEIAIIDAQAFELYLNNMKSYMMQQVRDAYMTVFRSCDGMENRLASYRRSIRAVNSRTNFVFKDKNGEMDPRLEEDLPYDINRAVIELDDSSFGTFYIDAMEYVKRYIGKIVCFTGYIFKKKKHMLLIGRRVMTCCTEDISNFSFICDMADAENTKYSGWVCVEGIIKEEYFKKIGASIPVIDIMWIEQTQVPCEEIINLL